MTELPRAANEVSGGLPPAPFAARFKHALLDNLRRLTTAAIVFLGLFLIVRTLALEPFGVPTGSMAAGFLGDHREAACPRCGFPVVVGEPGKRDPNLLAEAVCPNCGQKPINLSKAYELPGDRVLVDKNVFEVRPPRRWEVAVFRCPVDDSKPYVKRVVGLPGEAIQVQGGDAYADGVLLRKSLRQSRECRVLIFDHSFAPAAGWGQRWLVEPLTEKPTTTPAGPEVLQEQAIVLDATGAATPALGLTYRYWDLDKRQEVALTDWIGYNGSPWSRHAEDVHDFAVSFNLEHLGGNGSFACRLFDGADSVYVEFPLGDSKLDNTQLGRDNGDPPLQTGLRLEAGKPHRIEFCFVDRRASLCVNGTELTPTLDLPEAAVGARKPVTRPVQFGVRGASVRISGFQLHRDVHLRNEGLHGVQAPHRLAADEYFVLGDNSAQSSDSREWAVPGVPRRSFLGKPFLIHQPLKLGTVTVAGQVRTYQAIDWSRLRWVR